MLSGCARAVHLHPITDTDFYVRDNGDVCFSEDYYKHTMITIIDEK
jgi:hypothetical protein